MGKITTILRYLPHFIAFAVARLPFVLWKSRRSEQENWRLGYEKAKRHVETILKVTDTRVVVTGKENIPDEPVLFLGNHQSIFDVLVLLSQTKGPTCFVAKKEISKWPVFSGWIEDMGCLFIDREDIRASLLTIQEAARRIREEGMDGAIYPEGTRSKSSVMGEFMKGSFKVAQRAHCPIVPVMIEGSYRVLEEHGLSPHQTVYLQFLPPIYPDRLTKEEEKVIHKTVKASLQTALEAVKAGQNA
ncbi:1-acyl-sn-glycerol-3-phosphate acyltransferase [Clostridiaceae bacterium JG1575]|nr:1-acyl-sn-glycerol-3-phosphate acyltransferase [Clostridiaceae bacterium JG1575]